MSLLDWLAQHDQSRNWWEEDHSSAPSQASLCFLGNYAAVPTFWSAPIGEMCLSTYSLFSDLSPVKGMFNKHFDRIDKQSKQMRRANHSDRLSRKAGAHGIPHCSTSSGFASLDTIGPLTSRCIRCLNEWNHHPTVLSNKLESREFKLSAHSQEQLTNHVRSDPMHDIFDKSVTLNVWSRKYSTWYREQYEKLLTFLLSLWKVVVLGIDCSREVVRQSWTT